MALKLKQIASMIGAAIVVGIVAVHKDTLRSWFAEPKPKKIEKKD